LHISEFFCTFAAVYGLQKKRDMKVYDYEGCEDYYSSDFLVDEFEECIVSVDEMLTLYEARKKEPGSHGTYDITLQKNAETGLLYSEHNVVWHPDLLVNHLVMAQLYAHRDEVDWRVVSDSYDYEVLDKMQHILTHPLVWVPTESVSDRCVVQGAVAKELDPPDDFDDREIYGFIYRLREEGLLWFADTMPVKDDVFMDRYYKMPKDMVLWDKLLHAPFKKPWDALHEHIEYIAAERGGAKAMEIISRFREDWDDIVLLHLFDIEEMSEADIERLRKALFEELDRSMRIWQREAEAAAKQEEQVQTAVACRYIDKDKLAEAGIHTPEQFTTMLRQACEQDAKALGAFLKKYFKMGYLDFHGDGKKKIYEHLKECFPGAIKYGYPNFTQFFD